MAKIVFCAGIWDMLHSGHRDLLKRMREEAGYGKVIAVIHSDESCYSIKQKFPVQDLKHRKRNLKRCGYVDKVLVTKEDDPYKCFQKIINMPGEHLYLRGDDVKGEFPGRWFLEGRGVPIEFKPYTKGVSSSKIRDSL